MGKTRRVDDDDRNPRAEEEEHLAPRIADKETLKTIKVVRLKCKDGQKEKNVSEEKKNPFASLEIKAAPLASGSVLKTNGLPTAEKQFSFNFNKSIGDSHAQPLTFNIKDPCSLPKDGNAASSTEKEGAAPKFNFHFGGANAANTTSMFNFATAAATFTGSKRESIAETDGCKQIDDVSVDSSGPPSIVKNNLMSSSILTEQIDPSQKTLAEILQCNLLQKGDGKEWNDCGGGSVSLIQREGKAPEVIMHANQTKRLLLQVSVDRTFGVLSKNETSVAFYAPKMDPITKTVKPAVWRIKFTSDDSSKAFVEILTKVNAEKLK